MVSATTNSVTAEWNSAFCQTLTTAATAASMQFLLRARGRGRTVFSTAIRCRLARQGHAVDCDIASALSEYLLRDTYCARSDPTLAHICYASAHLGARHVPPPLQGGVSQCFRRAASRSRSSWLHYFLPRPSLQCRRTNVRAGVRAVRITMPALRTAFMARSRLARL